MTIRNNRLRELQAKAEAAGQKFEEGKKRLYQADGSPLFAADVHREEMEKLARERNHEILEVEREAREIRTGAAGVLERLENSDPAELLTDEELTRANARRPFAGDAAESLPVEDLKRRLESVLQGGDRANVFAHLVAGRRRREALLRRQREQAGSGAYTSTGATLLDETLDAMQKALGGEDREAELEAAGLLGREADQVEYAAGTLRYEGGSNYRPNLAVPGPSAAASEEVGRLARVR